MRDRCALDWRGALGGVGSYGTWSPFDSWIKSTEEARSGTFTLGAADFGIRRVNLADDAVTRKAEAICLARRHREMRDRCALDWRGALGGVGSYGTWSPFDSWIKSTE